MTYELDNEEFLAAVRKAGQGRKMIPDRERDIIMNAFGYPTPEIHACCTIVPRIAHFSPDQTVEEAISMNGKLWNPGDSISFGFLDGSRIQQVKAQKWAEYWLQVANLTFQFGRANPDVRITFAPGGSWSYIGTDCRNVRSGATMQFGWVTDVSDDTSDRAVIVHEVGHMLGLGHEQSSPFNDIKWNRQAALNYYMSTQGWSAQMVEDNVFTVFDESSIHGTAYDRSSIMQYPVPPQLTTDGRGIGWNTDLSPLDRSYVASLYPGTPAPPPVQPTTPPTPVAPPSPPTPLHTVVTIGKPAVHGHIPAPGQPALFSLNVPQAMTLQLGVALVPSLGRAPGVVVQRGSEQPLRLGMQGGKGLFNFAAGDYTVSLYNPMPRQTGVAWIKVAKP